MSTPNQNHDEFSQIGSDEEVDAALKPKKTINLPAATAVLAGVVVLAIGLAGGAGLHAAFASSSTTTTPQAGRGAGAGGAGGYGGGGYGGFRGGQGPGTGGAPGSAAIGTVVSASGSELVVKTQTGNVTVKLTGDTTIDITSKGAASDLKAGEQVVVSGQTANGTLTATTVRQGGVAPGRPSGTPSN
jgi:hypothetical protein